MQTSPCLLPLILFGLTLPVRAYDATFSDALDQPGRTFDGSGWSVATGSYAIDGVDAISSSAYSTGTRTISTEVPALTGVRCKAIIAQNTPVLTLTMTGPGGVSRAAVVADASGVATPTGNALSLHMVTQQAGAVTWTSVSSFNSAQGTAIVDQLEIFDPAEAPHVGEALDQPGRTFLSAAPTRWVLTTSDTHDNEDALMTGALVDREVTDLQTAVPQGMNGVRFWVKTSGAAASTFSVSFNNDEANPLWSVSGASEWTPVSVVFPQAGGMVRWAYRRGGAEADNAVRMDSVEFFTVTELQDAIDVAEPVFAAPVGAQAFTRATAVSLDGIDAAQSAPGAAASVMEATASGPAVLSWDSRVTGGAPALQVQLDGGAPYDCNDTTAWVHHTLWVSAGSHTIRFTAVDAAAGGNLCLVDRVKFTPWNGSLSGASGLTFTQPNITAWERVPAPAGSRTAAPDFQTASRTVTDSAPFSRTPVLSAAATGPGWLSYRSSVTAAPNNVNAGTLLTPVPSQNHSSGTRFVSMAFSGAGPHPLTWEFRGDAAGTSMQQATLSDVEWKTGAHPLVHPGPWVIGDENGWTHEGVAALDWGATSGSRTHTISTVVSGPGTLSFGWLCQCNPIGGVGGSLSVAVGGVNAATIPMSFATVGQVPTTATKLIEIPAGPQTVKWTLNATLDRPNPFPSAGMLAKLENLVMVNPMLDAVEALDTSLPLSSVSGWIKESAADWRGGDRLAVNSGSGILTLNITGPAVLSFRAASAGTWEEVGVFTVTGPGGNVSIPGADPYEQGRDYHALIIPAGTHTVSFNATAGNSMFNGTRTWKLDALDAFNPADYAPALNNTLTWIPGGSHGYAPILQTEDTHDGIRAVSFHRDYHGASGNFSSLTTSVAGPGLVSWWEKGSLTATLDALDVSSPQPPIQDPPWTRRTVRLTAGAHTLTFSFRGFAVGTAWLDQVKPGTPFENWLAGFLTDAQLSDPALFSAAADADGDGRSALMEYALQTSPLTPSHDRAPVLTRDAADPALLHFTWRQSAGATGVNFTPEASADLNTWTALPATQTGTDGTDTLMRASFRIDSIPFHRYVRLRVSGL